MVRRATPGIVNFYCDSVRAGRLPLVTSNIRAAVEFDYSLSIEVPSFSADLRSSSIISAMLGITF